MKAWVARDKNKDLLLYTIRPHKVNHYDGRGWWQTCGLTQCHISDESLSEDINPQWEDDEPIEVNVNITKVSDDVVTISKDRYKQLLQYEQEYISRQSMINSFMQNK